MRVLFLGAGASKCAGYPLANELMPAIRDEAENTRLHNLKSAWQAWTEFLRHQKGPLALLLKNPNPEVVLSAVDLCELARETRGAFKERYADQAWSYILSDTRVPNHWSRSAGHRSLFEAGNARNRFIDCLEWFFTFKHEDDSKEERRNRRGYLRDLLLELRTGDVVITLNWDTTVERSLEELGRWNPVRGYGFERTLRIGRRDDSRPLPSDFPKDSEIVVLKPHGSYGWHQMPGENLYFGNYYFLPYFTYRYDGLPFFDPDGPDSGPDGHPVLAYPSFLKQLGGGEMQHIWHLASDALQIADKIDVWGYSLPESDIAVRVLLNPVRFRLAKGQVAVRVHEPYNGQVRHRWTVFLNNRDCVDKQALGSKQ